MTKRRNRLAAGIAVAMVFGLLSAGLASAGLPAGGTFIDDNGNIHEGNIEAIAAAGITRGCNPPTNDRYCPSGTVTRGQMAAFLSRALGLPAATKDFFTDDADSIFQNDINKLAASGITRGCNPPANTQFCPDRRLTRGEMAAFLVRAFGYDDPGPGNWFIDDDDSIFEGDIDKLRVAGVTKGCNPPTNNRFCPNDQVLRDQMASFLARALGLTPIQPPVTGSTLVPPNPNPSGLACDFDGDGYEDLPIGAPGESVGTAAQAGSVIVVYGSAAGLTGAGSQLWTQNSSGVADTAEADDRFGSTVECGDFNGDGWSDLAIGVPGEDLSTELIDAGVVHVLYGSSNGLQTAGAQLWSQQQGNIPGEPLEFDAFGTGLAAGDFNGDGCDELAIGTPGEDATVGTIAEGKIITGGVHVLYGAADGLTATGTQLFTQDTAGIPGVAQTGDEFGTAVAAGDVDNDGDDDLVIGAPGDAVANVERVGSVTVLFGTGTGITTSGSLQWTWDPADVGAGDQGMEVGRSVATGDVDGDGRDEIAAGVPGREVDGAQIAGGVSIVHLQGAALTDNGQFWSQGVLAGTPEDGDLFGWSVAMGDFDGNGLSDVAVGIPLEDAGGLAAGGIQVLPGNNFASGPLITQATASMLGDPADLESFGEAVRAGDFNGDGKTDLAVGVVEDVVGSFTSAGSVAVLRGSATGVTVTGNQLLTQGSGGLPDAVESGDFFGFVGSLQRSLDIGVPAAATAEDPFAAASARRLAAAERLRGSGPMTR